MLTDCLTTIAWVWVTTLESDHWRCDMIPRTNWLILTLLASSTLGLADSAVAMKPGGWSEVPVTDPGVVAAAAFAVQAQQAAMRESGDQSKLSLESVAHAEQQVVQGANYRLTLRVQAAGKPRTAEAVVWARVWLDEGDRYQLTSWRFSDATAKRRLPPR